MIDISYFSHDVYGKCVRLTDGIFNLEASLEFGPRILHFSLKDKKNMFYNDETKSPLGEKYDVFGGDQLILYGGHRIWTSPEIMPRCYHPDNCPVEIKELENGIELTGAVEKANMIQKTMRITASDNGVKIVNTIKNAGQWDIEFSPWTITMMASGGKEVVPTTDRTTGLLHNRNISLWDYSDIGDQRLFLGNKYITLQQNPDIANPFKIGINNEKGWAAYFNFGQVFFKTFERVVDGDFPDNGCSYETYTNDVMLEMEALGEFVLLEPDCSVSLAEQWFIYEADEAPSNDEAAIDKVISKYLK